MKLRKPTWKASEKTSLVHQAVEIPAGSTEGGGTLAEGESPPVPYDSDNEVEIHPFTIPIRIVVLKSKFQGRFDALMGALGV